MDQSAFVDYWNEAVQALIYDVHQIKGPITVAAVNGLWRKELLDNRFFSTGLRHGAAAWLENAEKEDAQKGLALRNALHDTALNVGLSIPQAGMGVAGAAVTAGGGWIASHFQGTAAKIGGMIAGAVGLGMVAKTGSDVYTSISVEKICNQITQAAERQLEEITALF